MNTNQADNPGHPALADLLAAPLLAAAQSNQALALATCEFLEQVWLEASSQSGAAPVPEAPAACQTRRLNIDLGKLGGAAPGSSFAVNAPLAALIQPSQLTVHGLEIDFTVEVKDMVSANAATTAPVLYGVLSANSRNARPSDPGGRYDIRMHAQSASQTAGMAKLIEIFAATIEPLQLAQDAGK